MHKTITGTIRFVAEKIEGRQIKPRIDLLNRKGEVVWVWNPHNLFEGDSITMAGGRFTAKIEEV